MIKTLFTKLLIGFLYLVSLLPFWALYIIADVLFFVLYYLVKYRREVVNTNLKNAFPEKTTAERSKITIQYYGFLADLIVETIKTITLSEKKARQHFKIINPQLLESYYANGKSVIAAAGHYGNWEIANIIGLYTKMEKLVVYKPLSNKVFDNFFMKVRSRFNANMIPMKMIFRKIIAYKNNPTLLVLVSDQTPTRSDAYYFTEFLNQETAVFLGIEKIAKTTDYPVVFMQIEVVKRGYYTCELVPLIENPKDTAEFEITNAHVKFLEAIIRKKPQYWLWSHRRWKFKKEDIL